MDAVGAGVFLSHLAANGDAPQAAVALSVGPFCKSRRAHDVRYIVGSIRTNANKSRLTPPHLDLMDVACL